MNERLDAKNFSAFGQLIILLLITALLSVLIGKLVSVAGMLIPVIQTYSILISYILSFLVLFYLVKFLWQIDKVNSGGVSLNIYLMVLPAIFGLTFLTEGLVSLMPMPEWIQELFANMVTLDLKGYLTIGIAAPILEELIFRGLILNGLLQRYKPDRAILWSAIIFGTIHLNPWQFVPALLIGLFIGWMYWKTNSIWPGVFIHFVNNSFSFYVGWKFQDINTNFIDLAGSNLNYAVLLLLAMVFCYGSYYMLKEYFSKNSLVNNP